MDIKTHDNSDLNSLYIINYTIDETPDAGQFKLHSHDSYEMLIFFCGDAEYISEGSIYPLGKNDLVIARPHEMHKVHHLSNKRYKRCVLGINNEFFDKYNCCEYKDFFSRHSAGTYNMIKGDKVIESGILDLFNKIKMYSNDFKDIYQPVISAIIIEILYILNTKEDIYEVPSQNTLIRNTIRYINEHFCEKLNLSNIARDNFVSKYYLCRVFKDKTGYTITSYVNHKRLQYVRELCNDGMGISNASVEAGFSNYSAFYKACMKETSLPPKDMVGK